MPTTSRRSVLKTSIAMAVASQMKAPSAQAASYEQPASYTQADLGGVLTPFGSVKAGNADGTIPAWDGGYSTLPAAYKAGDPIPDAFPDDQMIVKITSNNMAKYQAKLSVGQQGLLQKYPDFNIQVFQTRRTAIAPQYVYDYIAKNAINASLVADGIAVEGAYGGIPFPIPKNGNEVIWNHLLAFQGSTIYTVTDAYAVTASGQLVFEERGNIWLQYPYYFPNGEGRWNGLYKTQFIQPTAPPYAAGGSIVQLAPVNTTIHDVEGWTYLIGQRRVRRAPELQFDTPNSLEGGVVNWDEGNIFNGKLTEYNFNFLGIQEIYVPYNSNKFNSAPVEQQYLPHFVNPDLVRWELHRCRVVELTLKPGYRNVDARRIIYCDEDTGAAVMGEVYDANGGLWKLQYNTPWVAPQVPTVQTFSNFILYDLHAGNYASGNCFNSETKPQWKPIQELSETFFSPGQLAASSGGY
jgi:hypothetical protein